MLHKPESVIDSASRGNGKAIRTNIDYSLHDSKASSFNEPNQLDTRPSLIEVEKAWRHPGWLLTSKPLPWATHGFGELGVPAAMVTPKIPV